MNRLKFWSRNKQDPNPVRDGPNSAAPSMHDSESGQKKGITGHIPRITLRTVLMAILVAMGGFIFGMFSPDSGNTCWILLMI